MIVRHLPGARCVMDLEALVQWLDGPTADDIRRDCRPAGHLDVSGIAMYDPVRVAAQLGEARRVRAAREVAGLDGPSRRGPHTFRLLQAATRR